MASRTILCPSGAEAARKLNVDTKTLYRWAKEEKIAARRGPGGHWQVFLEVLPNNGTPIYMTVPPDRLPELLPRRG